MKLLENLIVLGCFFVFVLLIFVITYGLTFLYMHYKCKDAGKVECNWFECSCETTITIQQAQFYQNATCSINGKVVDCANMKYPYINV